MTPEKERATRERALYDGADAETHRLHDGIGKFIAAHDPSVSSQSVELRSRLLLAGDRAETFWERVHAGMPLNTAVRLLRECERQWRTAGEHRDLDDIIAQVLAAYDQSGHQRLVGGKVVRTRTTVSERAAQIAKGRAAPAELPSLGNGKAGTRAAIREACAAWIARATPPGDPRAESLTADALREIEVVLDSFAQRLRPSEVSKAKLHAACDLLNIPRPRWRQRAAQERAWKNRKNALKATHPDTLGHDGSRAAFQAINDAYDVVVAYNDSLAQKAVTHGE